MNRERRRRFHRKNPWGQVQHLARKQHLPYTCRMVVDGLRRYWNATKHARLYVGDVKLAEKAGCSPISVYRAKLLLERLHIVAVQHTRGGWTRNPKGELVRNATGYEPHPELASELEEERRNVAAGSKTEPPAAAPPGTLAAALQELALSRAGP